MSSPRIRRPAPALTGLVLVVLLASCGGSTQRPAPGGAPRATVRISVIPASTTNQGRPLYAVVRTVTLKQFVEDQYGDVAQLVVNPDDTVLASFVVFPGIDQTITIDRPAKGGVAVYFLFTDATGTSWKRLFDSPPSKIRIELSDSTIGTAPQRHQDHTTQTPHDHRTSRHHSPPPPPRA